jgi:hypothetical protein
MITEKYLNDIKNLIRRVHNSNTHYDESSDTISWKYNITDSLGNSGYIISLNTQNGSVWFVGDVNDIINGIYCKKVYTERDVLEMLHSFKNDVSSWNC